MKSIFLLTYLFFCSHFLLAQSIDDLYFGSDSTFDIVTWNIEWFPKNGPVTADYVTQIIEALDADILALQEISDTALFRQMADDIDGYEAYFESVWFGGLAYLYKPDIIDIEDIYEIYFEEEYWRPFPRSPMLMEVRYLNEPLIIINNHLKCCGDGFLDLNDPWDQETRRFEAANLLQDYIDIHFPDESVIVLGDLNDILTDNSSNNVFRSIITDAVDYLFADMDIATGPSDDWSYPGWPSHLDHLFITNELFPEYYQTDTEIATIRVDDYLPGGWDEYESNVSDHRPVAMRLNIEGISPVKNESTAAISLSCYPNPAPDHIIFRIHCPESMRIKLYLSDIKGQLIEVLEDAEYESGIHLINWDSSQLSDGLYFLTWQTDHDLVMTKIIIQR